MRFIRDIIKEKREADATGTKPASGGQAPYSPLVLEEQQMADPIATPEPLQSPITPSPVAETQADDALLATPTPEPVAEDEPQEAISAQTLPSEREQPSAGNEGLSFDDAEDANEATETDVEDEDTDTDLALGDDPFAKLRGQEDADAPVRKAVSPMRRAEAQSPPPTPKSEVEDTSAELDALMPAADAIAQPVAMPAPAKGRGSARSGRVKTRLLGFSAGSLEGSDPFEKKPKTSVEFPVGWLVVVSDMGRGASFALHDGVSKVGRGIDQTVSLNFGDNSISRDNHVSIAYDAEQNKFFIGHSGKTNLVRVNNVPLLSTEELKSKDLIRLGETTLRFMAFCADDFSWVDNDEKVSKHA